MIGLSQSLRNSSDSQAAVRGYVQQQKEPQTHEQQQEQRTHEQQQEQRTHEQQQEQHERKNLHRRRREHQQQMQDNGDEYEDSNIFDTYGLSEELAGRSGSSQYARQQKKVASGQNWNREKQDETPGRASAHEREQEHSEVHVDALEEQLEELASQVKDLTCRVEHEEMRKKQHFANASKIFFSPEAATEQQQQEMPMKEAEERQHYETLAACAAEAAATLPYTGWVEPQHPSVQALFKAYTETLVLLKGERDKRSIMRADYEKHLQYLRRQRNKEKSEIKKNILLQVDFLLKKYKRLACGAVAVARRERERVIEARQKARQLAEEACKAFELDLKSRTKAALEKYQTLAQQAQKVAQQEREQLASRCKELEHAVDEERRQFDTLIVREAEERIAHVKGMYVSLKDQLEEERRKYTLMMAEVAQKVEKECAEYEDAVMKGVEQLLRDHGVSSLDQKSIRSYLLAFRKELLADNTQAAPVTVTYRFQALSPKDIRLQ